MQLDTDEGEGFSLPAGVVATPNPDQTSNNASAAHQESEEAEENNQGIASA